MPLTHLCRLLDLKASQLKHVAFLLGLPSTGSKPELDSAIRECLSTKQRLFERGGRVVSVDMGIRNLAVCVLDVPPLSSEQRLGKKPFSSPLTVSHWRKRDLLSGATTEQASKDTVSATKKGRRKGRPSITASIPKDAFTPSVLSQTAYDVTKDILSYKPSAILIERQRFRSGGAAAIQEWTIRVNMLESMLWACLHTMRRENKSASDDFPCVHEVSPARVASFWTAGPDVSLRPQDDILDPGHETQAASSAVDAKSRTNKVQKSDKIAIVRAWLHNADQADVSLDFKGEAAKTAAIFAASKDRNERRAGDAEGEATIGKLDDLADCLLQAVAWVRWNENCRRLGRLLEM